MASLICFGKMKKEDKPDPFKNIQELINEGNLSYTIYQKYVKTEFYHIEGELVMDPPEEYPGIYFKTKTSDTKEKYYIKVHTWFKIQAMKANPKFMDLAIFVAVFDLEKYGVKKN